MHFSYQLFSFSLSAISEWFYYCIWLNKQTLQTHYTNKPWSLKSKHITIICLCDPNEWTQSFTKVEYWIHDQSAKCTSKSTWCWNVFKTFCVNIRHSLVLSRMHAFIFEMAVTRHWYWSMQKWPSGRTKSNICKFYFYYSCYHLNTFTYLFHETHHAWYIQ